MISTLIKDASVTGFLPDDVAAHQLNALSPGSGRFNLQLGIRFATVRNENDYRLRVFSGPSDLAAATAAILRDRFTQCEIAFYTVREPQIPINPDLFWFSYPVLQARGPNIAVLMETTATGVADTNVLVQVKLTEFDVV